jgi:hypothetical protein
MRSSLTVIFAVRPSCSRGSMLSRTARLPSSTQIVDATALDAVGVGLLVVPAISVTIVAVVEVVGRIGHWLDATPVVHGDDLVRVCTSRGVAGRQRGRPILARSCLRQTSHVEVIVWDGDMGGQPATVPLLDDRVARVG